jgi:stage II sporulation protein AA (anti-sigma F factor antagonist)
MPWHRVGEVIVVRVLGKDLLREDAREILRRVVAENPGCNMVLNCEGIDYISSSSLGAVFSVYRELHRAGRQLILASLQPSLLEVLQMVRVDRLFKVVPDEETALSLLAGAKTSATGAVH